MASDSRGSGGLGVTTTTKIRFSPRISHRSLCFKSKGEGRDGLMVQSYFPSSLAGILISDSSVAAKGGLTPPALPH